MMIVWNEWWLALRCWVMFQSVKNIN